MGRGRGDEGLARPADGVAGRSEGSTAHPPVREGEVANPVARRAERLRAQLAAGEPESADVRAGRAEALRADDPPGRGEQPVVELPVWAGAATVAASSPAAVRKRAREIIGPPLRVTRPWNSDPAAIKPSRGV
jgi:hypothetical protein